MNCVIISMATGVSSADEGQTTRYTSVCAYRCTNIVQYPAFVRDEQLMIGKQRSAKNEIRA